MLTVSQLAQQFGISRTSILYYERQGLLLPSKRGDNGYRWYGQDAVERLGKIMAYRSFGVPVAHLASLLAMKADAGQQQILQAQFNALEQQIQQLRLQQKAIVQYMDQPQLPERGAVSKERWTQIMRNAGLSDEDMHNWHIQFEHNEPDGHQAFLESLDIEADEIARIRRWSRP
ncbi:MerR family transcriptional regulator [Motiliproteus coralliicola]|uniref:MerR family transcriptional regulator n=1 Tax=Motiliproteus coralliicola TaxID=2283196 RepID=A0A369WVJ6_9GAMM|nr:MerR family transcriptional regulator [Motiliproteus coralliicola]RDE25069.1 MerR family transcriptional regulator [Motiliproteus coralliicola]